MVLANPFIKTVSYHIRPPYEYSLGIIHSLASVTSDSLCPIQNRINVGQQCDCCRTAPILKNVALYLDTKAKAYQCLHLL